MSTTKHDYAGTGTSSTDDESTLAKVGSMPIAIAIEVPETPSTSINTTGDQNCSSPAFYGKAQQYWSNVPATVNGMLGGLGFISAIDLQGSANFLRDIKITRGRCALDCGAGIGRVSKNLLMPRFDSVDLVEQDAIFANKARDYCTTDAGSTLGFPQRLGEIYNVGLQCFTPENSKYDLVWSQWVLGHLTDADLLSFFQRIRDGLALGGCFVMKENITSSKQAVKDEDDSSVTRPLKAYKELLPQAGFRIVRILQQKNFPKGLYPVFMIACRSNMALVK